MYRKKLNELCQKKKWGFPEYSYTRDGPDHKATYEASVIVNGETFTSPSDFTSSKEARNQAALQALLTLNAVAKPADYQGSKRSTLRAEYGSKVGVGATKPQESSILAVINGSTPTVENGSKMEVGGTKHQESSILGHSSVVKDDSTPTVENGSKMEVGGTKHQESPILGHSSVVKDDTDLLSKGHLENYARRNDLDPPIYAVKTDGPPHHTTFKATVFLDGKFFESPTFYHTLVEAEHAAAKNALMSLSVDLSQKGESGPPYKSLLLELTQREGFFKPTYKTTQIGTSSMPTFFSTVEVEGEEFHGKASRSQKHAEQDAAKIAYIALKECGLEMYSALASSFEDNKAVQSIHTSEISKSKQNRDENMMLSNGKCPSSSKSSPLSRPYASSLPVSESKKTKTLGTSTYLHYDKFKVYANFPDIVFTEGITITPVGDNKWVASESGMSK